MLVFWAVQNGCPWGHLTLQNAVRAGNLPLLRSARSRGCPWNFGDAGALAECQHFEALRWAVDTGCELFAETLEDACRGGSLEIVQWLRSAGCPWVRGHWVPPPPSPCTRNLEEAASGGHVSVIAWLRGHGCPWSVAAGLRATEKGHLEALQWMHAEGCPLSRLECLQIARDQGHEAIAEWIESL